MTTASRQYKEQLADWLAEAVDEGWIDQSEATRLKELETAGADQLFDGGQGRPLTVGFFGGTGVGKSSLLNRLVGETVAEVGVLRPTSTVVTLYAHEQFPLGRLETLFPVDRVRVLTHRRDAYRDVVWIDMPDMDSVERSNRELVLEWLPYIDWLVYVVSPERYRDDAGWRVLKERGYRHHWLFVMNRWDAGSPGQPEDFARLLLEEGVRDPLVLKTVCGGESRDVVDDFDRIKETVDRAVAEHGLEQLQAVGEQARLRDLEHCCERYASLIGDDTRWRRFVEEGQAVVKRELVAIKRAIHDEAVMESARIPDHPGAEQAHAVHQPGLPGLVQDHVQDIESGITLAVGDLPGPPVIEATRSLTASLPERLEHVLHEGFRRGAARPGGALQRGTVAALRRLVYGLPLAVCAWIAYVVVVRYQQGLAGEGPFLGLDFLIHSLMVLALAALGPYLLARLLRPSARRSILTHVDAGLRGVRTEVTGEWTAIMENVAARARTRRDELSSIRSEIRAAREA